MRRPGRQPGATFLIDGSRSMGLEQPVSRIDSADRIMEQAELRLPSGSPAEGRPLPLRPRAGRPLRIRGDPARGRRDPPGVGPGAAPVTVRRRAADRRVRLLRRPLDRAGRPRGRGEGLQDARRADPRRPRGRPSRRGRRGRGRRDRPPRRPAGLARAGAGRGAEQGLRRPSRRGPGPLGRRRRKQAAGHPADHPGRGRAVARAGHRDGSGRRAAGGRGPPARPRGDRREQPRPVPGRPARPEDPRHLHGRYGRRGPDERRVPLDPQCPDRGPEHRVRRAGGRQPVQRPAPAVPGR